MRPVSKNTVETSTSAVRSSTARASRGASVSSGRSATRTISSPSSASRSSWRRMVWNSPSVVTSRGRRSERQRGKQTHDELVRIRRERYTSAGASQQPCEAVAHVLRLRERMLPFVVDVPCGVEPCILVRLERLVGPGLMRMAGQQQAFRDAEPRVERRERIRGGVQRRRIHVTAPCESPTDPGTAVD